MNAVIPFRRYQTVKSNAIRGANHWWPRFVAFCAGAISLFAGLEQASAMSAAEATIRYRTQCDLFIDETATDNPGYARQPENGGEEEKAGNPDGAFRFRRLQLQDENGEIPADGWERARRHVELMNEARRQRLGQRRAAGLPTEGMEGAGIDSGSWSWLGPGNVGGRIRSIAIHPTQPNRIWIGSVSGGIWRTDNSGASWEPVDDFLANLAITSIVINPVTPGTMYAGTGEGFGNNDSIQGAGIFKSTDGGLTWNQLPATANPNFFFVTRITISSDGTTLLAATGRARDANNVVIATGGVQRSTDGGTTWSQRTMVHALDIDFLGPDATRAVVGELGSAEYSTDGGLTWAASSFSPSISGGFGPPPVGRVELATHRSFIYQGFVYASVDQNSGDIYRSNNGGVSYTRYGTGTNYLKDQGWYDNVIWSNPNDPDNLIVGGVYLWKGTIDFGTGTTPLTQISNGTNSPHADNHIILEHPGFDNAGNKALYFGNDGGIFRADNFSSATTGSGWTPLNNSLGITQFYGAAVNENGIVVGGAQDNGTQRIGTGGPDPYTWTETFHSDGGMVASDQADPNYFYGERQNLQLHRSTDAGLSAAYIFTGIGDTCPEPSPPGCTPQTNFVAPLVLDPNNSSTLLAGGWSLWRSTNPKDPAPAWASIKSPAPGNSPISAITVSPLTSDLVLVGHNNGRVYRTFNGTATTPVWDLISTGLPGRMVTRIVVDPNHPGNNWYYVTFGGFSGDNIYRSTDNGVTWNDVTGVGATGLPSVPVRSLVYNPINSKFLYAGTEIGIFTSEDAGATWGAAQDGPANVSVDELFFSSTKVLYAATHGRGVYRTSNPVLVPPEVNNTDNDGPGSLRNALAGIGSVFGTERKILFNIPGTGVKTINLQSGISALGGSVTIDGWSQAGAGYTGQPLIELNGAGAVGTNVPGLILSDGNNTVRGLIINRFSGTGIILRNGGGNRVQGCYIGTDAAGATTLGNGGNGIDVENGPGNLIGRQTVAGEGNLISGNTVGIWLNGANATGNMIRGNYIGTDVTGTARLSNTLDGIRITGGPANTIGGTNPLYGNIISGNGVTSFGADGIEITGAGASGNIIQGNYIGLAANGNSPLGNLGSGVRIDNAPGTLIGGTDGVFSRNVIVDNRNQGGIALTGAGSSGTTIQGNYLGTNLTGNVARANNSSNIYIESANNLIGGVVSGAGNLISGFDTTGGIGISLFGLSGSTGNVIQGNFIGTNVDGTTALSRVGTGIEIRGGALGTLIGGATAAARNILSGNFTAINDFTSNTLIQGNYIGTNVAGAGAVPNEVGIVADGGTNKTINGNIISGNGTGGAAIRLANTTAAIVQGNRIGTNATGTAPLGNGHHGIQVFNSANCLIGGATAAARNLISASRSNGIFISAANIIVQGNYIGTDVSGTMNFGNGLSTGSAGIEISFGNNNTIGGANAGEGNIIAFNGCAGCFGGNFGSGIRVFSTGNRIVGNSFFDNIELGIDLSGGSEGINKVTPNDHCDADAGPNNLQNFPVLTSAATVGGSTSIGGSLDSTSNTSFQIDFYSSPTCDPSGYGEGKTYLGSAMVNTDGACNANIAALLPVSLTTGSFVTATATDSLGNTSEFSACLAAEVVGTPTPTPSPTPTTPPTVSISGTVSFCPGNPRAVANVTLGVTGDTATSTMTDSSGNYTIPSLPSGGNYTVTPAKENLVPGLGTHGINTADALAVQRHFLGITGSALTGCALAAGDVNADSLVTTTDALAIQQFFLFNPNPLPLANRAGQWQFNPANRAYPGLTSNQTGQDYDAFVLGDVNGDVEIP